mmetsp:Transcript_2001/g.3260  ORF Transcript_2001/g.3260 Transcript_2001/m.3260 type:complete len:253 (+) Transcript_2001:232-990(+)
MALELEGMAMVVACGPWFVFFQACYWLCRLVSPLVFDTYNRLESGQKGFWCSSMVSSFHAVLVTVLSSKALISEPKLMTGDFFEYTPISLLSMEIFFGYITSDLLLSLYFNKRWNGWVENLVHHVCIIGTWTVLHQSRSGQFLAMVAHICELTTPFVNQRWFLYEANLKNGKVYFYNGLAMVFLWFATRILFYTGCGFTLQQQFGELKTLGSVPAGVVVFCYTSGLFLQYFWFYKIVRGAIKSVRASRVKTE